MTCVTDQRAYQGGFTLVEMLIVIFIIVLSAAVVFPVSFRMLDRFDANLSQHEQIQKLKQQEFLAFIRDEKINQQ